MARSLRIEHDRVRLRQVEQTINDMFGELAPDEVDVLAEAFEKTTTRMFEVVELHARRSVLADLFDETEFKPVRLPPLLTYQLAPGDVFLMTLGYRSGSWHLVWSSAPHRMEF